MNLITIEQAREHCKTDAVDDMLLTLYVNAAEKVCAQLANRGLFADQETLDAALAGVPATMTAAHAAHATAVSAAASLDAANKDFAVRVADAALMRARIASTNIVNGIVVDEDIIAAILLTTGHFYRNREEVTMGNVKDMPLGAQRIMAWYRWAGSL